MQRDSAQGESAPEQGKNGQQIPGLRASLALESLREVAAGQRHGRLITPRTSAEGQSGDQAQPRDPGAAAAKADNLHAESSVRESESGVSQSASGAEKESTGNPQPQHAAGDAMGSGDGEDETAAEQAPASPARPAQPALSVRSGNPFASPVSAKKQTLGGNSKFGAAAEG